MTDSLWSGRNNTGRTTAVRAKSIVRQPLLSRSRSHGGESGPRPSAQLWPGSRSRPRSEVKIAPSEKLVHNKIRVSQVLICEAAGFGSQAAQRCEEVVLPLGNVL